MARNGFRLMGRREAIGMLGASAWAIAAPEQAAHFTSLDHLEFFASDVVKSTSFYARIFGAAVLKNNRTQRRYIKLGSAYIAIDQGQEIHVDHFCAGSEGFQIANLHSYLDQRGIPYEEVARHPAREKRICMRTADFKSRLACRSEGAFRSVLLAG